MNYKNKCIEIMADTRHKLMDIINNNIGNRENIAIEIKRDLGDFVDYMTITKIENGFVYFKPTEFCPDGLKEEFDALSANELYDLIMGTNLNIKEPEEPDEFYYKIDVHKVKKGYSFMVSSPNELEDEVILDLAVLNDLFEDEEDSDCAEVDCLVDETDVEVFRQSGRLHRI